MLKSVSIALVIKKHSASQFLRISIQDILSQSLSGSDKKQISNVDFIIASLNQLSSVFALQILNLGDPNDRAKICEFFIKLANKSINSGDLNGFMTIVGMLNNSSISRLTKTWNLVGQEEKDLLKQFVDLLSGNYKKLREKIQNYQDNFIPYVPFLGLYNSDFTFIKDGNNDISHDSKINLGKLQLYSRLTQQIWLNQNLLRNQTEQLEKIEMEKMEKTKESSKYSVRNFYAWVKSLPPIDDTILYNLSQSVEPSENRSIPARSESVSPTRPAKNAPSRSESVGRTRSPSRSESVGPTRPEKINLSRSVESVGTRKEVS